MQAERQQGGSAQVGRLELGRGHARLPEASAQRAAASGGGDIAVRCKASLQHPPKMHKRVGRQGTRLTERRHQQGFGRRNTSTIQGSNILQGLRDRQEPRQRHRRRTTELRHSRPPTDGENGMS